jgi:hypothetical protein
MPLKNIRFGIENTQSQQLAGMKFGLGSTNSSIIGSGIKKSQGMETPKKNNN